jgi:hypothetical protein
LQLWFRGPTALGDFIVQWCGEEDAWAFLELELLPSHHDYVANVPDDRLAVEEVYMARCTRYGIAACLLHLRNTRCSSNCDHGERSALL